MGPLREDYGVCLQYLLSPLGMGAVKGGGQNWWSVGFQRLPAGVGGSDKAMWERGSVAAYKRRSVTCRRWGRQEED